MRNSGKNYDRLARLYDKTAHFYSGGQIHALKTAQAHELRPGERVLYAGVGSGEDAVIAAARPIELTILDASPGMIEQASQSIATAGRIGSVEILCSDVLQHDRQDYYDVIVANFFLNIFSEDDMIVVLGHLAKMLKPGGRLMIGDFSHPRGSLFERTTQRFYYLLSMTSFWLLGGTTLHPIYDYQRFIGDAELRSVSVRQFKVSAVFPASFETIVATKN
jgi:ubiquinone/menaquinone biosynthesis C-methylase UbiE